MKIVGIDASLASTGVAAVVTGVLTVADTDRIRTKPTSDALTARLARLQTIVGELDKWLSGADLVVIESPAYASATGKTAERAGLWWLIVQSVARRDIPILAVPPAVRAKYATGKGNAGKDEVLAAVVRRYPNAAVVGNDEADALILASIGARILGSPIERLPDTNLAALKTLELPAPLN